MSTTGAENGSHDTLNGALTTARRSLLIMMALFGLLLILLGMTVMNGVYAGLFGIWGALLIVVAVVGIASIKLLQHV